MHFLGPGWEWVIFSIVAHSKHRVSRGLDVKWRILSTCLDASEKWFSTRISNINRPYDWLWLETQEARQNVQNVHIFQVRRPICQMVPISRAYGLGGDT